MWEFLSILVSSVAGVGCSAVKISHFRNPDANVVTRRLSWDT